jgi:hypothetical protein
MKPRFVKLFLYTILLLLIPHTEVCAFDQEQTNRVSGIVVDGLGQPIGQVDLCIHALQLRTKADGTFAGEIIGPVPSLWISVRKDGYAGYTKDYGPRWQDAKLQNARLVLRKPTTLTQIEQLSKLNGKELSVGVRELLASDRGASLIIDQKGLLDAFFHLELHVRPALKALVTDEHVGVTAQILLKFFADPADADLLGGKNQFKPAKTVAAKTLEEAVRAVMTDAQLVGWPDEYKILGTTLNEDGTKAFVRGLSGGVQGEWYIFCFHKEQNQWVLKSVNCTWRA